MRGQHIHIAPESQFAYCEGGPCGSARQPASGPHEPCGRLARPGSERDSEFYVAKDRFITLSDVIDIEASSMALFLLNFGGVAPDCDPSCGPMPTFAPVLAWSVWSVCKTKSSSFARLGHADLSPAASNKEQP
jgi:hypothetical protein